MATDSSHRVIIEGNGVLISFSDVFNWIPFILAVKDDMHTSLDGFGFGQIRPRTRELAAFERLQSMSPLFLNVDTIDRIHFKCVGTEDMHKITHVSN